ncbi:MAG: PQQ-binding-like beta-propeller repeat protein [Phycisphaerae bacterium]|jgi:outer membrane protein assembly factor BamB|nr:PQQ-binding-like beta-propeller repeat protein [Phycisphaerae bacterium]
MATAYKDRQPGGCGQVIRFALAGLMLLVACGAARGADTAKLIASPEPDWPQWRGPKRDAVSTETGLLDAWPEGGPKLLWKTTGLGRGWCSPIIVKDTIYICGEIKWDLMIFAMGLDGEIKWRAVNGKAFKPRFRGSRAACTYSAGKIYHMNGHGRVICLDAKTGKEQWVVDMLKRFDAVQPYFGASECLLVDGNNVIVTPVGKKALIAALDKKTGKTVWSSEPARVEDETTSYASPILVKAGKRRLIISTTQFRTFAADADTGKIVWWVGLKLTDNVCSTIPVLCGNTVLITNTDPKEQNSSLLRISADGGKVRRVWNLPLRTTSGSVVQVDSKFYIAGERKMKGYLRLDAKTGKTEAKMDYPSNASAVWADGKLYVMSAWLKVMMLKPTDGGFKTLGSFPLIPKVRRRDAWAHPVLFAGRLYLRYHDTLFCYDVKGQ